jgi:hypothetical protein
LKAISSASVRGVGSPSALGAAVPSVPRRPASRSEVGLELVEEHLELGSAEAAGGGHRAGIDEHGARVAEGGESASSNTRRTPSCRPPIVARHADARAAQGARIERAARSAARRPARLGAAVTASVDRRRGGERHEQQRASRTVRASARPVSWLWAMGMMPCGSPGRASA